MDNPLPLGSYLTHWTSENLLWTAVFLLPLARQTSSSKSPTFDTLHALLLYMPILSTQSMPFPTVHENNKRGRERSMKEGREGGRERGERGEEREGEIERNR